MPLSLWMEAISLTICMILIMMVTAKQLYASQWMVLLIVWAIIILPLLSWASIALVSPPTSIGIGYWYIRYAYIGSLPIIIAITALTDWESFQRDWRNYLLSVDRVSIIMAGLGLILSFFFGYIIWPYVVIYMIDETSFYASLKRRGGW